MGLSEQGRNRLNHGRVRVKGVMTRYTHLQHIQVGGGILIAILEGQADHSAILVKTSFFLGGGGGIISG